MRITLALDGVDTEGELTLPRSGRGPGLVLLDGAGLDECEWYAERGFVSLRVDSNVPSGLALQALAEHPVCTGRVALLTPTQVEIIGTSGRVLVRGGVHSDLARLRTLDFLVCHLLVGQHSLAAIWDEHVEHEFVGRNTEATLRTMVDDAYVNHVPVLTGGNGLPALREFYSQHFIRQMPPDTKLTPLSRTIGDEQIVDELIFEFTHSIQMDWMLPGIPATGKFVQVALVAIVKMRGDKLAHEHIYWDQASVLVQLGLLDPTDLPVAGIESAQKAANPQLPARCLN